MNVYDFDETILEGDSEVYFFRYCIARGLVAEAKQKEIQSFLLTLEAGQTDILQRKDKLYSFVNSIPDLTSFLEKFWDEHECFIKPFYKTRQKENDVISSATPRFLLEPIIRRLGIQRLLATEMNLEKAEYVFLNGGENKVFSFKEAYPNDVIDEFYSDSDSDTPLARLAKKAYKVTHNMIQKWDFRR